MASYYFTGNTGIVKIGSRTLCVTGWSCTIAAPFLDGTGTCDEGYQAGTTGVKKASGSVRINLKYNDNPMGGSPAIGPGEDVALELYLKDSTTTPISIPSALITEMSPESTIGVLSTFTFSFESNGTFTWPTGSSI